MRIAGRAGHTGAVAASGADRDGRPAGTRCHRREAGCDDHDWGTRSGIDGRAAGCGITRPNTRGNTQGR
ncbi:MAG: hypothetical protein ACREP0_13000, partial [Rhodanobacteraceae bacterium]